MNTAREYQAAFQQDYPEVSALTDGTYLSAEQARQFSAIIGGKITELSRKPELSRVEQTFIDRTMDLGARSAVYLADRYRATIPVDSPATERVRTAVNHLREGQEPIRDVYDALGSVTGSAYSMRTDPHLRTPIEDTARGAMQLFGEMANASDGRLMLDGYLEGNLQNIVAHFEQVEQQ